MQSAGLPAKERRREALSTLIQELKRCGKRKDLQQGKLLHSNAIQSGCHRDKYVANGLMTMYCKCGCMKEARDMFDSMTRRDVVSWTALIVGYTDNGQSSVALDVFQIMDCQPDGFTFAAVLRACTGLIADCNSEKKTVLQRGIPIHRLATKLGFHKDIVVANTLVDLYGKCGEMKLAFEVFRTMERDAVSWNALLHGYVENGQSLVALEMFHAMDCQPDRVTFLAALKACAGLVTELRKEFCLEKGAAIHRQLQELGFDRDIVVASTLVDVYRKLGEMRLARGVFNRMVHRNAVSWTALILGYVENGQSHEALNVFNAMDCQPDGFTFVAALKACTGLAVEGKMKKRACLEQGMAIHARAADLGYDKLVTCTLIEMYSACGNMALACETFDRIVKPEAAMYTALALGYVDNGESLKALEVVNGMECEPDGITFVAALKACARIASECQLDKNVCLEKCVSVHRRATDLGFDKDIVVANTLVDMYSRIGDMKLARDVFDGMSKRDVVSWTSLIMGYVENGKSAVALDVFTDMDCQPNEVTFVAALKACACMGALEAGQKIHARVRELGLEQDQMVSNSLVDFYAKCGHTTGAEEVFSRMRSPSTVSWNALIGGYSLCGDVCRVFSLVKHMQESGSRIDGVTILLILSACSYAGMLEEGTMYFESMHRHGVSPTLEHYNCLVNILGRANKLDEALSLIKNMPPLLKANGITWTTLLGACRKWKNPEIGKVAFDALVELGDEGDTAVAYVLMGDIYRNLGRLHGGNNGAASWKAGGQTFWCDSHGRRLSFVTSKE